MAKKPSRKKMIETLAKQVEGWDLETLIDWASERMQSIYEKATDDEIERDYLTLVEREEF